MAVSPYTLKKVGKYWHYYFRAGGKRYRGSTKTPFKELAIKYTDKLYAGLYGSANNLSTEKKDIRSFIDEHLLQGENNLSLEWQLTKKRILEKFLVFLHELRVFDLRQIKLQHLEKYRALQLQKSKPKTGCIVSCKPAIATLYGSKESRNMTDPSAKQGWTNARLLKRSCESLLGVCSGIIADGELNDQEIRYLDAWLTDNQSLASTWPGEVICARIKAILADNKVTEDEREHLKQTLSDLIGGTLQETGAPSGASTSLPVDEIESIEVKDNIFCFTGNFLYGTRNACELAVTERNGKAIPRIRKDLNYLVIGTMASRDWANTSHGRKIEKAIEFKKDNCPIYIIEEKQWVESL